ncbi:alpha/beta hydrolase [Acidobacteria bacterium AB60]|nr:alpha/beta hydrolase [Acidobacteria bacterium AB60]
MSGISLSCGCRDNSGKASSSALTCASSRPVVQPGSRRHRLSSLPTPPSQLIFLPGALGDQDFWKPLAREARTEAERVFIAYPGFAGAPADPSITSLEDLVSAVASRIHRPAALIAQSMGGVIALELALRKATLITHLVLVATSGGLDTSQFGAVDWRPIVKQHHPDLPTWFASYHRDLSSALSGIRIPVLLLWGDRDPLSPLAVGNALLARLPHATMHVVPGGEHDLARVHAMSIAPLIDAHLQNRRTPGSLLNTFVSGGDEITPVPGVTPDSA